MAFCCESSRIDSAKAFSDRDSEVDDFSVGGSGEISIAVAIATVAGVRHSSSSLAVIGFLGNKIGMKSGIAGKLPAKRNDSKADTAESLNLTVFHSTGHKTRTRKNASNRSETRVQNRNVGPDTAGGRHGGSQSEIAQTQCMRRSGKGFDPFTEN